VAVLLESLDLTANFIIIEQANFNNVRTKAKALLSRPATAATSLNGMARVSSG